MDHASPTIEVVLAVLPWAVAVFTPIVRILAGYSLVEALVGAGRAHSLYNDRTGRVGPAVVRNLLESGSIFNFHKCKDGAMLFQCLAEAVTGCLRRRGQAVEESNPGRCRKSRSGYRQWLTLAASDSGSTVEGMRRVQMK